MRRLSVYVKGNRNSTAYYRIYQYLDNLDNINVHYNIMYPLWVQKRFMPVPFQSKPVQCIIYLVSMIKMLYCILKDLFHKPDVIIIHKRVISRYMPTIFKVILNICHSNGCRIIWDFDDHIVKGREISQSSFNYLSKLSDEIIVTHNFLKSLVPNEYQNKVTIMPTTDGDMFEVYEKNDLDSERLYTLDKEIKMVWVATSANIKNLLPVLPCFDEVAKELKEKNKSLILKVICDKPIESDYKFVQIENIRWTRQAAIQGMREAHIGIMPLVNNDFNKGKGGFKLVQYISIGLPCIGSKVGFNEYVLSNGCGYLVNTSDEWKEYILQLSDKDNWQKLSQRAYQQWCERFSFVKNLNTWKNLISK